jgi:hypothetical protein
VPGGLAGPLRGWRLDGGGTLQASLPSADNTEWEVVSSDATAFVAVFAYCSPDVTLTP